MRKLFTLLLAVAACVGTMFASVTINGLNYYFDETENTAEVVQSSSVSGDLVIPSSVTYNSVTYSVTSIGVQAFFDCSGLTSVTIPNSVTSIGYRAFYGCSGLASVTIPNSVTSIGDEAFSGCSGLTSITIPNSVTSIGDKAFSLVANIVYSGSATGSPWGARSINGYVDGYLVYSDETKTNLLACSSAATGDITIPNSVTSIGGWAFSNSSGLTSVTIPNSVTSIREYAFAGCSGLTSVTIPNSVTSIGEGAFAECTDLTFITIPNSVTSIGNYAFSWCTGLTSITIPNSVTSIGEWAFSGCTGLTSITIPNSVTSIGNYAFYFCKSLSSIYNYATSPQVIDSEVFGGEEFEQDGVKYGPVDQSLCKLYVPAQSVNLYKTANGWKEFKNIVPIQASEADVTEVQITPSATTVDIAWPQVSGAASYELVIKDKDGKVICTLTFNAQGQLTALAFNAPARNNAPQQKQAAGFRFTVTGLEEGTAYDYTIVSKDENGTPLDTQNGSFTTADTPTAIDNTPFPSGEGRGEALKLLHNG